MERQQRLLEEASGDLVSAARDLLGVRLTSNVPALVAPGLSDLAYDFAPEVGWDQALVSGARTRAPAGIARRGVAKYLRAEAERIVDKHFGRARADFQDLLEDASRGISRQVDETFRDLTEGLRRGQRSAVELRSFDEFRHRVERERLIVRHRALADVTSALESMANHHRVARSTP